MLLRGSSPQPRWQVALGAAVLAAGLLVSVAVVRDGVDFPVLYVMGEGILRGVDVYVPGETAMFRQRFNVSEFGMFYPPATGFAMAPLALLPYGVAKWVWFFFIDVALVFGIRALVRTAAPSSKAYLWMSCAGVVLLSAAIRWGLMLLQAAPLVLGLLCLFVAQLHGGRRAGVLAISVFVTSVKMTLALPFLGLLALHRRFGAAAASIGAWLALNALGFWRMGGGSFSGYRQNIAILEALDNISSPDPWRPIALPRLDWFYLIYGLSSNLRLARILALAISAVVLVWLVREAQRDQSSPTLTRSALFLGPLVCFGSLCVYHHQYDACLFFAPALLACLLWPRRRAHFWVYMLFAPLLLEILFLPIGRVQSILESAWGLVGVGVLKLSFPVVVTLALVGSLVILRLHDVELDAPPAKG